MSKLGIRIATVSRALASRVLPRRGPDAPVGRILVAHYLLLGDTILLAPLLKALAARYPDAERVVLARPAVAPLFAGRPYGATVLPFDRRDPASRRRVLDSGPYDLAIVPDDNRYAWLARAAGARRVIGFANDRPAWKNWMLDRAVPYPDRPGAWADMAATSLTDGPAEAIVPFAVGEWPAPPCDPFDRPRGRYAVLHVGASTPLKQWPPSDWRLVADRLRADGLAIAWSGGNGERDAVDTIGPASGDVDFVGCLDLQQLWHLFAAATLIVCPDTGVAHLARLVGVPTIALFGPGSRVAHGPGVFWSTVPFRVVTVDDFSCRDQTKLYRRNVSWVRRCGRRFDADAAPSGASDPDACGRPLCMEAIEAHAVLDAVARVR